MVERLVQGGREGLEGGDQPAPVALSQVTDAPEMQRQQRERGHGGA